MSDQPQTASPTTQPTIIGGPEGNTPEPTQTTQTPAGAAPTAPASGGTPVIIGDRVFTNQEEAIRFANDLASERARYLQNLNSPAPVAPVPQQTNANNKIPIHQLMFEDPQAAIAELRQDIKQEIIQEQNKKDNTKTIWENFYSENKDLKGLEDVVEIQRQKNWSSLERLSVQEGMKFLAAASREYVSKIRGTANPGERVANGSTQVAGSSGAPAQRTEIQANKPSTFFDELKDFRNSKKTHKQPKGA